MSCKIVAKLKFNRNKRCIAYDLMNWLLGYPYKIFMKSGNEDGNFIFKINNSKANIDAQSKPPPRIYPNVTLHGETVIICPNITQVNGNSTTNISVTVPSTANFMSDVETRSVLLTIYKNLDYETKKDYTLSLLIQDKYGRKGNVTVRVRKN